MRISDWSSDVCSSDLKPTSRSVPVTDDEVRVAELEQLVAVGSRLSGAEALPVIVIGREDIERSGASSIAQVLSQRPEVSINKNGNTTVDDGIGNTGSDLRPNEERQRTPLNSSH